jgi:ribosome recycling factor
VRLISKSAKSEAEDEKIDCNARKDAILTSKKLEKDGTSEDICKMPKKKFKT